MTPEYEHIQCIDTRSGSMRRTDGTRIEQHLLKYSNETFRIKVHHLVINPAQRFIGHEQENYMVASRAESPNVPFGDIACNAVECIERLSLEILEDEWDTLNDITDRLCEQLQ